MMFLQLPIQTVLPKDVMAQPSQYAWVPLVSAIGRLGLRQFWV